MNYYKIEIEKKAKKKLLKMDKKNQFLILDYLKNTLSKLENPRKIGRKIIETLEKDEYFLRAKRIEVPASITAVPFYKKWDIVAKME